MKVAFQHHLPTDPNGSLPDQSGQDGSCEPVRVEVGRHCMAEHDRARAVKDPHDFMKCCFSEGSSLNNDLIDRVIGQGNGVGSSRDMPRYGCAATGVECSYPTGVKIPGMWMCAFATDIEYEFHRPHCRVLRPGLQERFTMRLVGSLPPLVAGPDKLLGKLFSR